ncbi:hypothetical protein [Kitasatospora sp. NPDC087314]|uniref:hypothetical protein n=1 Tax=Kitasatospora sp. NPDC087314 TaxID=3364068 RepID=UPI00381CFC0B
MPDTLLLFVTLDNANWPLAACRWVRYTANGCATGSIHGTRATTPEDAAIHFTASRRDRDREYRRGVRYRLVSPDTWRSVRACVLGECTHQTTDRPAA